MLDPSIFEKPFIYLDSYSKRTKKFFNEKEKFFALSINPPYLQDVAKIFIFFVVLFSLVTISIGSYEYVRGDYNIYEKIRIGAVCSDGWRSTATGSGACSWHGGVDHWLYKDIVTGRHISNHQIYFVLFITSFFFLFYASLTSQYLRWIIARNFFNYLVLLLFVALAISSVPITLLIIIIFHSWKLMKLVADKLYPD
jgi:hypothetical protein